MKKWILASLMLFALSLPASLAGCAGQPEPLVVQPPPTKYIVVTADYAIYIATTQPVIDAHAATISFTNDNGEKVSIMRDSLKGIKELN